MTADVSVVLRVTVTYDVDAAGDRPPLPREVAENLRDHLLETWNDDDSIVEIATGEPKYFVPGRTIYERA